MRKYVLMLALAAPLTAAAQYTIIDLGTLGGGTSFAYGLNSYGHVAGMVYIDDLYPQRGFLWRDGGMTDLGVLPGYEASEAYAVNDLGWVVGRSFRGDENESTEYRATVWHGGNADRPRNARRTE